MDFKFENQEYCPPVKRKEFLSSRRVKIFIIISSLIVFFSFFILQTFLFLKPNNPFSHFQFRSTSLREKPVENSYIFPLLVNLKGEKGPQLARIKVFLTFSEDSLKQEFLSQGNRLKKHLLFVLSSQESKMLNKNKDRFEKQIRSQLNAFLSKNLVHGVRIQTKILN